MKITRRQLSKLIESVILNERKEPSHFGGYVYDDRLRSADKNNMRQKIAEEWNESNCKEKAAAMIYCFTTMLEKGKNKRSYVTDKNGINYAKFKKQLTDIRDGKKNCSSDELSVDFTHLPGDEEFKKQLMKDFNVLKSSMINIGKEKIAISGNNSGVNRFHYMVYHGMPEK